MGKCTDCGAALDPNEICDCAATPAAELAASKAPASLIVIRQLPAIEQHLEQVKPEIEAKVRAATALACSPETLKSVKDTRAELNKEFRDWEAQRGQVKKAIEAPYDQFKKVYDDCVANPYAEADAALAKKISAVESGIKQACLDRLTAHFKEQCEFYGIDFLPFAETGVKVDMATARLKEPKKAMETIEKVVKAVSDDVAAIQGMEHAAEIMIEYKRTLNFAQSVGLVQARHRDIEQEKAQAIARQDVQQARQYAVQKVFQAAPELAHAVAPTPTPAPKEEVITIAFSVTAPRRKLRDLVQFLNAGGYEYKDLTPEKGEPA